MGAELDPPRASHVLAEGAVGRGEPSALRWPGDPKWQT